MRDVAEKILLAESLEDKLTLAPELGRGIADDAPGGPITMPEAPGRPDELKISAKALRVGFPGVNKLDDDHERGKMLHFLANHELMAAELMALVLLKFPDAPREYRRGVYEAMREEQMHTLMYLRRMKECGIHFGELPVNDYFWKLVAPMETPMDFVTRLNLTFEQANLDFSKHYATLFRQVGDSSTASVLEKIYLDEIGHVGHGVKWFRRWKQRGETDWRAFAKSLSFPLAPAKAKGMAPFNAEGRRLAGLDEDFISRLEVCEQSRGRTPVVHWYNPNAESHAAAALTGKAYHPNKMEAAMEHDLEMLILAWCRRDDIALLREPPGNDHLAYLKAAGFDLPEVIGVGALSGRKLGGLRPWAWSPDGSRIMKDFADEVSANLPWHWRESLPSLWLSKECGHRLNQMLAVGSGEEGVFCCDFQSAQAAVDRLLGDGDVLLKSAFACAGRGHRRVKAGDDYLPWLEKNIEKHHGVMVEPWLDRVLDFSALYEMRSGGVAEFIGMTKMENDAHGRFQGIRVYPKWGTGLDRSVSEFLFRDAEINQYYGERMPKALAELLEGYLGPVGVDAMVFRRGDGSLGLRHVVELNVRMTMGRVALELQRKTKPGASGWLRVLRKNQLEKAGLSSTCPQVINNPHIMINDPDKAREFVAVWSSLD